MIILCDFWLRLELKESQSGSARPSGTVLSREFNNFSSFYLSSWSSPTESESRSEKCIVLFNDKGGTMYTFRIILWQMHFFVCLMKTGADR